MNKTIFIISLIFTGCAAAPQLSEYEINELNAPISCKDKAECDSKWSKTQSYIVQNSKWKIKVATDTIIQTEGPFDQMELAYSATKSINSNGSGEITVQAACGNYFACETNPKNAIIQLKRNINN